MAFTEFYVDNATGSNINAGDDKTVVTSTNGDWGNAAANRFTAATGTPFSGVSVGDFASVYLDGATVAVYIGRVTAVNAGGASLDISATVKAGTAPTTGATGRTCTVGGKWAGPTGSTTFPINTTFAVSTITNVAGDQVRINVKGGTTYTISASLGIGANARVEGYTTTVGDGGFFTIDGGTGSAYAIMSLNSGSYWSNCIVLRNGSSGSNYSVTSFSDGWTLDRLVIKASRNEGLITGGRGTIIECEFYSCVGVGVSCNQPGSTFIRCIAHDNAGGGFSITAASSYISCIADSNTGQGFVTNAPGTSFEGCEAYNNSSDGIRLSNTAAANFLIENCNMILNGGWGINGSGSGTRMGWVRNCGFGAGTQANVSGTTTGLKGVIETASVTYASNVTPWVDPANGDFRISLPAAENTGRGTFTETAASYTGTVGFPDIGAATHAAGGGGSTAANPLSGFVL